VGRGRYIVNKGTLSPDATQRATRTVASVNMMPGSQLPGEDRQGEHDPGHVRALDVDEEGVPETVTTSGLAT